MYPAWRRFERLVLEEAFDDAVEADVDADFDVCDESLLPKT